MLPELEYYAVTESRFPPHTVEMNGNIRNIHWGTYNYKIETRKTDHRLHPTRIHTNAKPFRRWQTTN